MAAKNSRISHDFDGHDRGAFPGFVHSMLRVPSAKVGSNQTIPPKDMSQ